MRTGIWSLISSFEVLNALSSMELDYIMIDFEHGQHEFSHIEQIIRIIQSHGKKAVCRIVTPSARELQRVYDGGADGIQFAGARDLQALRAQMDCSKNIGFSPWVSRARRHPVAEPTEIFQIEFPSIFDSILKEDNFDEGQNFFLGRYDLARSLGIQIASREELAVCIEFAAWCRDNNHGCWTVSIDKKEAQDLFQMGFSHVSTGSDTHALEIGLNNLTQETGGK